jgi:hypothetical protein
MVWIAGSTVGAGGVANISFSSIPQTFTHLQIRLFAASKSTTTPDYLGGYINGDGANNYARHNLVGNGSAVSADGVANAGLWAIDSAITGTNATNIFSSYVIDFLDYTSTTKNKTIRSIGGYDTNGAGQVRLNSNLYFATPSAITGLSLFPGSGFAQYTRADLYGITTSQVTGA